MAKAANIATARVKKQINKNVKTMASAHADNLDKLKETAFRSDGWANVLTGLGQINRDKNMSTLPQLEFLSQDIVEALYQVDDISAKIVDLPVSEMFREEFKINIPDDKGDQADWIFERLKQLKACEHIDYLLRMGRLYGTACLFFGSNSSKESTAPASPSQALDFLRVVDRYQLQPSTELEMNLAADDFGFPVYYDLTGGGANTSMRIHKSWLYRFDGVKLPYAVMRQNQFWGDSVLSRPFRIIQIFNSCFLSVGGIVQDINTPVFKLTNLVQMISENKEDKIIQRMALAMLTSSVFKGIVLQTDESYERPTAAVSGVSELVNTIKDRMATAADIPHTILFNEAPGGSLGGTGVSEKADWYDKIKGMQIKILTPILMEVIKRICQGKGSMTGGVMPENLTIEYFPLWQPTEKEQAEARKVQADIDAIYIDRQVVTPDEIAESRFGSGEYSFDTKIDMEARAKFEADDQILTPEDGDIQAGDENPNDPPSDQSNLEDPNE